VRGEVGCWLQVKARSWVLRRVCGGSRDVAFARQAFVYANTAGRQEAGSVYYT
jgi:hypothetical protein